MHAEHATDLSPARLDSAARWMGGPSDATPDADDRAVVYRMVMDDHVCPYGLKAVDLLEREGFLVRDEHLESREETDAFQARHGVDTTPQVFIGGERIGGYEALREELGHADESETTYQPVIAIFGLAAAFALAIAWSFGSLGLATIGTFAAFAMSLLALQKLRDVEAFTLSFLNYDLLARRWVPYAAAYAWLEAGAGVLMLAGVLPWLSGTVAAFIGTVGAASVIKAVWIDGRELECACVGGGDTQVPLGPVSLLENLMMLGMGIWTWARFLA